MENERTIRRLEEENAMLKEEVQILRDMILDMKFDDVKYLFTTCSKAELMDISHKGSFPFTFEFLQDAGIAVIFRPFHEAAGAYQNGPWFWWGADGVEVTRQLWDFLYDQLTNKYGINNLIWEWTVQTSSGGAMASNDEMASAYVGNTKCDLVGVDLYPTDDLWNDFDRWYAVRELVAGKKMVALSECGMLFNPENAFASGESWLYFMQWYETPDSNSFGIMNYSPAETWKAVMNSPYVLDRAGWKALMK